MAQLVIAAAGAAIGSAIAPGVVALGLTGGGIGWIVGSLIGSTFGPTQKAQGPRLGDLSVGGSAYGSVIPYIDGHPRIAGQIIWASSKREIATTRREGGKGGGGGTAVTTYTYEVDLLIELTDCEIDGVRRIWSGGDLVYTVASDADAISLTASFNTPQWTRMSVYSGASDQLPDPDYEAAVGTNNAPAYRGRGTVFIKSLQLGQNGQIPNLTFEVLRFATTLSSDSVVYEEVSQTYNTSPSYESNKDTFLWADTSIYKFGNAALASGGRVNDDTAGTGTYLTETMARMRAQYPGTDDFTFGGWVYMPAHGQTLFSLSDPLTSNSGHYTGAVHYGLAVDSDGKLYPQLYTNAPSFWYRSGFGVMASFADIADAPYPTPTQFSFYGVDTGLGSLRYCTRNPAVIPLNTWVFVALYRYNGQWWTTMNGTLHRHCFLDAFGVSGYHHAGAGVSGPGGGTYYPFTPACTEYAESIYVTASGSDPKLAISIGASSIGNPNAPKFDSVFFTMEPIADPVTGFAAPTTIHVVDDDTLLQYNFNAVDTLAPADPSISDAVDRLCLRSGLSASQLDTTGIDSITTPVHGLTISQVSTVRSVLEMLMGCYFFDCVLSDKLYFRPRAGAAAATITNDELGWVVEGQDFPDPLPLTIANELELPAQMALTYNNIDGDYQTDTQYSDRLITGQENTTVIQVPLGFTAAEAKVIADARLTDAYVARLTSQISLNLSHSNLEPSDVILVLGSDGSQYRQRLVKRTDSECVLVFDTVADDSTVFSRLGITVGGTDSQTTVAALPDTDLELLDIPLLRDADNRFGIYVAVSGGDNWHVADVYHSSDGVNYVADATFTQQAVIGRTTGALDDWTGGTVFDESSSVVVNVSGELESVTRAEILNSQEVNAAVIGNELVQFRSAVLQSAGVYKLTGFLRGRRGTEWAMVDHSTPERFVLLTTSGMRFLELQAGDLARLRYYKGVSAGQRLSAVVAETVTPMGVNLKPWSPVNVRVDRTGADPVVTWIRRTRLSTRVGGPIEVIPLGEVSEAYEVDVYSDDTFTTVIDTISTTTATATITEAGSPTGGPLYLRIYQISEAIGRGYPAEVTLP